MEIMVYDILLWNYRNYSIPYKKILKHSSCVLFPFCFLYVFLVSKNLLSKYEKFLILTKLAISTLAAFGR